MGALLPAARAGDPAAACRLAIELQTCATLIEHGETIDRAMSRRERHAESSGDLVSTLWTVDVRHLAARHAGRCRGIDVDALLSERDWLWEAARQGHTESALRFLAGQSIGFIEDSPTLEIPPYAVMRHPHWPAWQARASALAEAMQRQGRPEVHFLLSLAHGGDDSPLGALYPNDPVERAAHLLALRAAMPPGTSAADPLRGLRPEQVEAARLRAEQLRPPTTRVRLDREALSRALESPLALVVRDDNAPPHPTPCGG